jgi:hypothetical protein
MRAVAKALGADKSLSWNTPDPCSPKPWDGVGCDADGRVTDIQVGKRRLTGTLAPEVRNLTALTRLEVFGNALSGPLPTPPTEHPHPHTVFNMENPLVRGGLVAVVSGLQQPEVGATRP